MVLQVQSPKATPSSACYDDETLRLEQKILSFVERSLSSKDRSKAERSLHLLPRFGPFNFVFTVNTGHSSHYFISKSMTHYYVLTSGVCLRNGLCAKPSLVTLMETLRFLSKRKQQPCITVKGNHIMFILIV